MRNTMRKVTIVVPVLMTSCHVSEYPKIGPTIAHDTMTPSAIAKAPVLPAHLVTVSESASNASPMLQRGLFFIDPPCGQPDEPGSPLSRHHTDVPVSLEDGYSQIECEV